MLSYLDYSLHCVERYGHAHQTINHTHSRALTQLYALRDTHQAQSHPSALNFVEFTIEQ